MESPVLSNNVLAVIALLFMSKTLKISLTKELVLRQEMSFDLKALLSVAFSAWIFKTFESSILCWTAVVPLLFGNQFFQKIIALTKKSLEETGFAKKEG